MLLGVPLNFLVKLIFFVGNKHFVLNLNLFLGPHTKVVEVF